MGKFITNFNTTSDLAIASAKTDGSFIRPHVSLTKDDKKVHFFKDPCESEKVETTYEWVEIGGVKWATKNVGAKSITDYGQYFSWGDINGFTADQVSGSCHSKAFSWADYKYGNGTSSPGATGMTKYNASDGKAVLESVDDAATANMGSGWRMPTTEEFQALSDAVTTAWTNDYQSTGIKGIICTAKDNSGAQLFFPAGGSCYSGKTRNVGSLGNYWSSSLYTSDRRRAYHTNNDKSLVIWETYSYRYYGYTVRGVVG